MPPSSDPSSKKSGKQRKPAVQSPSPPRRTGRPTAHRGNPAPVAQQVIDSNIMSHALIPVRSDRRHPDTDTAPPSYNNDASSAYDGQDDRVSISSEDPSPRSPHEELGEKGHSSHHNNQTSTHNGSSSSSNTHISSPKHVNVTGPQFIGEAASTKIMMDFLEKIMNEQLKSARAATGP